MRILSTLQFCFSYRRICPPVRIGRPLKKTPYQPPLPMSIREHGFFVFRGVARILSLDMVFPSRLLKSGQAIIIYSLHGRHSGVSFQIRTPSTKRQQQESQVTAVIFCAMKRRTEMLFSAERPSPEATCHMIQYRVFPFWEGGKKMIAALQKGIEDKDA